MNTETSNARGNVRGLVAKVRKFADALTQSSSRKAGQPWIEAQARQDVGHRLNALLDELAAEGEICETDLRGAAVTQAGEVDDIETAWREGWAMAYSGADHLYGDDGELQDNRWPCIDWRRDGALEIRRKIEERGNRAWQAALSQQPEARGVVDALELVVGSVKWDRTDPVSVEAMRRAQVALTGERNG